MATMSLLLLRHGLAEERQAPGPAARPDGERPLTERGRERTVAVVRRLKQLKLPCDQLLSSPLLRARQTARIARDEGLCAALAIAAELVPGAEPMPLLEQWLTLDGPLAAGGRLGLVGHEPDLSALAARLCGAPPGALHLKKAGVALLEWSCPAAAAPQPLVGSACLRLLLSPACLI
ncbi:phosphohistidine phosphatase SixA [Synechococcus sp. CS-1329]|uniref:phosphohistidine phosphatase SixA n=1 Tax=Synechococcus sp. CS-1329 TaxID=2847975 RepID=UPI00223BBD80|nr:phosphohistidine phosphatase SixA [Synechococcus sp. CS-1329]MCT0217574.1 phosphohistidine phosphatase SixA [Synechococcus sp. CS-1329]